MDPQQTSQKNKSADSTEQESRESKVQFSEIQLPFRGARGVELRSDKELDTLIQQALAGLPAEDKEIAKALLVGLQSKKGLSLAEETRLLAELPDMRQSAIRAALAQSGYYLAQNRVGQVVVEDSSARIKSLHTKYGDGVRPELIADLLAIAEKEDFVVEAATPYTLDSTRKSFQDHLVRMGMDAESADVLLASHLNLKLIHGVRAGYSEDEQQKVLGQAVVKIPPTVSEIAQSRYHHFVRAKGIHPDSVSSGFGIEGFHDARVLRNPEKEAFSIFEVRKQDTENPPQLSISSVPSASPKGTPGFIGIVSRNGLEHTKELAQRAGLTTEETTTYFEGGNTMIGIRPTGEQYALVGRDSLLLSAMHLDSLEDKQMFNPQSVEQRRLALAEAGAFSDKTHLAQTAAKLRNAGMLEADATKKEQWASAESFLAKLDITADLIAKDMGLLREQLIIVAQPDFHLDMELQPLAPGQVLVHDYNQDLELLEKAITELSSEGSLSGAETEQLAQETMDEIALLRRYQQDIEQKAPILQKVNDKIVAQLEAAGLEVVRVPGAMHLDEYNAVNFLNGIPGTSIGTNRQFYITNSSGHPALEKEFESRLAEIGIDTVYWVGGKRESELYGDYSPGRWHLGRNSAGIACLADHREE